MSINDCYVLPRPFVTGGTWTKKTKSHLMQWLGQLLSISPNYEWQIRCLPLGVCGVVLTLVGFPFRQLSACSPRSNFAIVVSTVLSTNMATLIQVKSVPYPSYSQGIR